MDTPANPPRIVLEGLESCPDAARAQALLDGVLAATSAPTPGWAVRMRVEQSASRTLQAEGDIEAPTGRSIAHRVLSGIGADCGGLARAMGVWAALVLDIEVSHARSSSPPTPTPRDAADPKNPSPRSAVAAPSAAEVPPAAPPSGTTAFGPRATGDGLSSVPVGGQPTGLPTGAAAPGGSSAPAAPGGVDSANDAVPRDRSPWPPALADNSTTSATFASQSAAPGEVAPSGHHDEHRTLELGLGTFLMAGTGSNAVLGVTPYAGIEVAPSLFVRPALAAGGSLTPLGSQGNANAFWFATRVDGCWRTPGTYARNRGMMLDLCGGVDAGAAQFAAAPSGYSGAGAPATTTRLPEVAIGPSIDLQGELGNDLAVAIRGVAGVNAVRGGFTDTSGATVKVPWFSGRLEVALSWRAR